MKKPDWMPTTSEVLANFLGSGLVALISIVTVAAIALVRYVWGEGPSFLQLAGYALLFFALASIVAVSRSITSQLNRFLALQLHKTGVPEPPPVLTMEWPPSDWIPRVRAILRGFIDEATELTRRGLAVPHSDWETRTARFLLDAFGIAEQKRFLHAAEDNNPYLAIVGAPSFDPDPAVGIGRQVDELRTIDQLISTFQLQKNFRFADYEPVSR